MKEMLCQSCGMKIVDGNLTGTNLDGTPNKYYCCYCYNNGKFNKDETMDEMIESCIPFRIKDGVYSDETTARQQMHNLFIGLKRWNRENK